MNITATSYIYELSAEAKVNILHNVIATGEIKSHEDLELALSGRLCDLEELIDIKKYIYS